MTDEQPPIAPPPPPLEPPPPPSHGPFAFPPPPDPNVPHSSWGPSPDEPRQQIGWPAPRSFYPLTIGRVFELAFSLYRFRFRTFALLGIVTMLPSSALIALANYYQLSSPDFMSQLSDISNGAKFNPYSSITANLPLSIGYGLVVGVLSIIALGAMSYAAAQTFSGASVSAASAIRRSLGKLVSWIVISVVIFFAETVLLVVGAAGSPGVFGLPGSGNPGLPSFLGLVFFVALGALVVFLTVRWSFTSQAVMLESASSINALRRSWRLVAGSGWRVLGYILGFGILIGLIAGLIGIVGVVLFNPIRFTGLTVSFDAGRLAWATFLSSMLASVLVPIPAIAMTLLYLDLRFRHGEPINPPGQGALTPSDQGGSVSE